MHFSTFILRCKEVEAVNIQKYFFIPTFFCFDNVIDGELGGELGGALAKASAPPK